MTPCSPRTRSRRAWRRTHEPHADHSSTASLTTARSVEGTSTGDGACADLGRAHSDIAAIRVRGLSSERAADLMRGGSKFLDAAGLHGAITREGFSVKVVRITRECTGSNGRRLDYTTSS